MSKDQVVRGPLTICGLANTLIQGCVSLVSPWNITLLKLIEFIVVIIVLDIIAWISYTLATTPSPKLIEEIEAEVPPCRPPRWTS